MPQAFPNLVELSLARMAIGAHDLACLGGLTRLTLLELRVCHLQAAASLVALQRLPLQALQLVEVLGTTSDALDDALRGMTQLHRLHVRLQLGCSLPGDALQQACVIDQALPEPPARRLRAAAPPAGHRPSGRWRSCPACAGSRSSEGGRSMAWKPGWSR